MYLNRKLSFVAFIVCSFTMQAQTFVAAENDTTVLAEYNDGRLWAYRQTDNYIVGMTNYVDKDNYGKNYQILIFIKNLGDTSVTFDPALITSTLYDKTGASEEMKVYTYEQYMKKIKTQQTWTMALTGFSAGLNASMAGRQTTYTTSYSAGRAPYTQMHTTYNYAAASAANMAAQTQIMTLGKMMSDDKKTISQGYLKMTTIHPDEGIIGYMNIKHWRGQRMTVNIPIGGEMFSFDWDVSKKKRKK